MTFYPTAAIAAMLLASPFAAGTSVAASSERDLMLNGSPAPEGRHRYAARLDSHLEKGGKSRCTGTLVAPDIILTAAHCVIDGPKTSSLTDGPRTFIEAHVGCSSSEASETECPTYYGDIDDVSANECWLDSFACDAWGTDLAIIRLNSTVDGVAPIQLAPPNQSIASGDSVTSLGWGTDAAKEQQGLKPPTVFHDVLHTNKFDALDLNDCNAKYSSYSDSSLEFCSGEYAVIKYGVGDGSICAEKEGHSTSFGDSGGPLILDGGTDEKDMLIGANSGSRSIKGEDKLPNLFASAVFSYEWIAAKICEKSESAPAYLQCDEIVRKKEAKCPGHPMESREVMTAFGKKDTYVVLGVDENGVNCLSDRECALDVFTYSSSAAMRAVNALILLALPLLENIFLA